MRLSTSISRQLTQSAEIHKEELWRRFVGLSQNEYENLILRAETKRMDSAFKLEDFATDSVFRKLAALRGSTRLFALLGSGADRIAVRHLVRCERFGAMQQVTDCERMWRITLTAVSIMTPAPETEARLRAACGLL